MRVVTLITGAEESRLTFHELPPVRPTDITEVRTDLDSAIPK